jgi:hypothetical protein
MNWRRGLLLAGIHLVVAGSLLAWDESFYWRSIKSEGLGLSSARMIFTAFQEEQTVTFNPCADDGVEDGEVSPLAKIDGMANLPVVLLTGWHEPCRSQGVLDSMVESSLNSMAGKRFHRTRSSETLILVILCVLVAVEWLFVGGFPLIRPRRWWLEPGALITILTLALTALTTAPHEANMAGNLSIISACVWLWWFGLLIWKTLLFGWRRTTAWRAPRSI